MNVSGLLHYGICNQSLGTHAWRQLHAPTFSMAMSAFSAFNRTACVVMIKHKFPAEALFSLENASGRKSACWHLQARSFVAVSTYIFSATKSARLPDTSRRKCDVAGEAESMWSTHYLNAKTEIM